MSSVLLLSVHWPLGFPHFGQTKITCRLLLICCCDTILHVGDV
jgi:hypothetical protein